MSKERELLKRFMIELTTEEDVVSLFNDIKECLAQPEQEPEFNFDLERMKAAIESPISDVTVDDLAKQVKQEPVVKITSIHADGENLPVAITGVVLSDAVNIWDLPIKNNDLLFLAPPKREPLSYEHLEDLVDKHHGYPMTLGRAIEKAHGIGGEE